MAVYGSKYSSNFYNYYSKYVEVDIRKRDYVGAVTALRNTEVFIEVNFQDNNTPIFGTGASIVILNQGEFADLDDLLTSTEKEFLCIIKYDGTTVFQGFSLCDLNEQQFMPFSRIKIQFTDYMKRAESYYMIGFFLSADTDLLEITNQLRTMVSFGADYELYINSTLFEEHQNDAATDTFIKQTYVENNMFFSDPGTYDNLYDMINKVLKPFGAFFYSCGDKWIIERQEDVNRAGNWVKYNSALTGSSVASLRQTYNKQNGDFKYVDGSQVLEYVSGLKMLDINLKDKERDTFVFNDYFYTNMQRVSDVTPDSGTLTLRTWYAYDDLILPGGSYHYKDMSTYVRWGYPPALDNMGDYALMGLYYAFEVHFPLSPQEPVMMNINYKVGCELNLGGVSKITAYYAIRADGGAMDGLWLQNVTLTDGTTAPGFGLSTPLLGTGYISNEFDVSGLNDKKNKTWSVSQSWNFTDPTLFNFDGFQEVFPSLWQQLGYPTKQKFMIYFLPLRVTFDPNLVPNPEPFYNIRINYLGDIEITLTTENIMNKLSYNISADFLKTEEQDIEFWDLDNPNFANGYMYGLGGIGNDPIGKTTGWKSAYEANAISLMDIYAKNKYRNYSQTVQKLKATILHDGHMKPLSVITDNQRSGVNFILQGYSWDLFNGMYEIVAEQYTSEEIIIETEEDPAGASSGDTDYTGDPGIVPNVPGSFIVTQPIAALSASVSWGTSTGATGYILQRSPYLGPLNTWTPLWITIYEGSNNSFVDAIQNEMLPDEGMQISYQVMALTTEVMGAFSSTIVLTWRNT